MSDQFKAYAVRSGDLWWSHRQYNFVDTPDETSFTPTKYGSAVLRISRNIKMFTKNVAYMTELYTREYCDRYHSLSYPVVMEQIADEVKKLEQWQNARMVEVTVNVTENQ